MLVICEAKANGSNCSLQGWQLEKNVLYLRRLAVVAVRHNSHSSKMLFSENWIFKGSVFSNESE